jgi:hypothetical protein
MAMKIKICDLLEYPHPLKQCFMQIKMTNTLIRIPFFQDTLTTLALECHPQGGLQGAQAITQQQTQLLVSQMKAFAVQAALLDLLGMVVDNMDISSILIHGFKTK